MDKGKKNGWRQLAHLLLYTLRLTVSKTQDIWPDCKLKKRRRKENREKESLDVKV